MTTKTEARAPLAGVLSEAAGCRSRDTLTIAESQAIKSMQVLGKIAAALEASSAAKSGGNTGNGTFVLDATTPVLAAGKAGVYSLRFTTTTNIRLEGPDGVVLGDIAIGGSTGNTATANEQIKGVVTQGGTPFAAGDGFDVTVVADDDDTSIGQYAAFNPAATDGTQHAAAVAIYPATTAEGETTKIAGMVRECEINGNEIEWPNGITSDQKAVAIAELAAQSVIIR